MSQIGKRLQSHAQKTKKIYIIPTQSGLVFIGVNFTLFLMGLVYANNLALLLAFGLFAILLLKLFQTHSELENLNMGRITHKSASEQESPGLMLTPPLPPSVELKVQSDKGDFHFKSSQTHPSLYALKDPKRQKITADYIKIFSHGDSGLFYVWTYRKAPINLYVYPKKIHSRALRHAFYELESADNGQFREHKNYQMGEHVARIDWKVFAKNEQLLVKKFEDDASSSLLIDVNEKDGDLEQKVSKAAFEVSEANKRSRPWALKTDKGTLPISSGPAHLRSSLELLSEL